MLLQNSAKRIWGAFKTRYFRAPFHQLVKETSLGSGVIFNRKEFITHSLLPLELSALRTFAPWQLLVILGSITLLALGIVNNTTYTLIILTSILSFIYMVDVVFNLFVTLKSLHFPPEISASPDELKKLKDKDLPLYSVLCPLSTKNPVCFQILWSHEEFGLSQIQTRYYAAPRRR